MRTRQLVVPPHQLSWFEAGQHCTDAMDGDLVLIEHPSPPAKGIRFGQRVSAWFHPELRDFTWANHVAVVAHDNDGHNLSEMVAHGHSRTDLATYKAMRYCVIRIQGLPTQRSMAVQFDTACRGIRYGFISYLALILDALTGTAFYFGYGSLMVCSAHATLVGSSMGLWPDRNPAAVFPMHVAHWFGASRC